MPIFCVKSVKIYTGQKKFTWIYSWRSWQIWGMFFFLQLYIVWHDSHLIWKLFHFFVIHLKYVCYNSNKKNHSILKGKGLTKFLTDRTVISWAKCPFHQKFSYFDRKLKQYHEMLKFIWVYFCFNQSNGEIYYTGWQTHT